MKYHVTVTQPIGSSGHTRTIGTATFQSCPELVALFTAAVSRKKGRVATVTQEPEMVTRVNLQSGKEYQEELDTPNYCSPASEAYWSA